MGVLCYYYFMVNLSEKRYAFPDKTNGETCMQAVESKIINRIYGKGRGNAFSKNDFSDLGSATAIEQSLSRLTKKQRIRRVIRGIYDYPKFSKLLNKNISPDIEQVAQALARKFGWTIQVSGNTALNVLGLSTQIPGKYLYLCDAKTKSYLIGQQELSFKKSTLKDVGLKHSESSLIVQAIKTLDKRKLAEQEISIINNYFDATTKNKILKDARYTTSWIYEEIKRIFKG